VICIVIASHHFLSLYIGCIIAVNIVRFDIDIVIKWVWIYIYDYNVLTDSSLIHRLVEKS